MRPDRPAKAEHIELYKIKKLILCRGSGSVQKCIEELRDSYGIPPEISRGAIEVLVDDAILELYGALGNEYFSHVW